MAAEDVGNSVDILPCRIVQMQAVGHPGDHNCGPHVQVFVLCEDSTLWVQYHSSPNSNVPNDGRWHPVVQVVQRFL
jgi:hypothetical protein